ncbi:nitrogen fixation protein NifQ [Paraburkholderia ferrariae]|uniref:nitrogen fixation protein NifQ n=1 Tax=Paraburkholderia ferrariae TaxID=386056 RepID=UPI0009FF5DA2|nr:nitrogen fixation protein NifQ [Paraburkholderia ferrariae]
MSATSGSSSGSSSSSGLPDFDRQAALRSAELLGNVPAPHAFDARLFARLVAAREVRGELALLGLTAAQLADLAQRHFAQGVRLAPLSPVLNDDTHAAYAVSMREFLAAHAAPGVHSEDARSLAAIVANACLRPDHLWRDLGLCGRDDVTAMLERYFPALVARNVEGLRWKKLLARELALATGAMPGPAPGCPGCEDFGFCFPPAQQAPPRR